MKKGITASELRLIVYYDPDTGVFIRKLVTSPNSKVGEICGWKQKGRGGNYISMRVNGQIYRAHRLAWLYMTGKWPKQEIDHKNRDGWDNRWSNLREANRALNMANSRISNRNTSGQKGIRQRRKGGRWEARVGKGGKSIGTFDTFEEARTAYISVAVTLYGEYHNP